MFGSSKKSSRLMLWEEQRRAALCASAGERWHRRRQRGYRLAVAAGTIVVVSVIVQLGGGNWGPPFTFREGESFGRDIRVKNDFRIEDKQSTQLRQEQAVAAVPPVFHFDPRPLQELQRHLTRLCIHARTGTLESLERDTLDYWALSLEQLQPLRDALQEAPDELAGFITLTPQPVPYGLAFGACQALAARKVRMPIENEADLQSRLQAAFASLESAGILDDKAVPPEIARTTSMPDVRRPDSRPDGEVRLTIRRAGGGPDAEVRLDQVLKSKLVGTPAKARAGTIYLHFSSALKHPRLTDRVYELVVGSAKLPSRLPATLRYSQADTKHGQDVARAAVPRQEKEYKRGAPLVEADKPITEADLTLLKAEHTAYLSSLTLGDHLRRWVALLLIIVLLAGFVGLYVVRFLPGVHESLARLIGVCVLLAVGLGAAVVGETFWGAAILPLTMTAMILALAFDQPFALVASFSMAVTMTVALGASIGQVLVFISGLTVAVMLLREVRTRSRLVHVGLLAGATFAMMTVAVGLLSDQSWALIGADVARRFFFGLAAGIVLGGILPFIERAFGIVTDISLLELADVSHPLLQELVRRAPGTYTHSITVATLAESAAEAIGANPLLTRVGAYFHDIGKMLKPHYFIENQTGENRHDGLAPAMSTLIIIGHVKDGVELGRQHKLPEPIVDFIQQHHGTTLVEYFYREATKLLDDDKGNGELEAAFRYPGPKPQSKEIGIVMLADALESASRALSEPAPGSLMKLVHEIMLKRLLDGQFDESGLTLTELRVVEDSLCKNLIALFHARVKYPEVKSAS